MAKSPCLTSVNQLSMDSSTDTLVFESRNQDLLQLLHQQLRQIIAVAAGVGPAPGDVSPETSTKHRELQCGHQRCQDESSSDETSTAHGDL